MKNKFFFNFPASRRRGNLLKCLFRKCLQIPTYLFIFDDFIMILDTAGCNVTIPSALKDNICRFIYYKVVLPFSFILIVFVKAFRRNLKIFSFYCPFQHLASSEKRGL